MQAKNVTIHYNPPSINNVVDWDGAPAIQSTVIDVTEQIRAQDALRDSERQLRLVTDALPVLITYVDSEQRYRFVNETAEKWYGRPRAEIVGRTIRELWDAAAYETWMPYLKSIREGWSQTFDETVTYPDGRTREVTESWVPHVAEDGEVLGFFSMAQDFTSRRRAEHALRESEERLKAILDHAPTVIALTDTDGRYQIVNRAFEKNSGVMASEAEGRTVSELFPGKFNESIMNANQEVIETGGIFEAEFDSIVDGRTFSVVKFPIRGVDGAIAGVGTIETDVTRRKEMMEALRASEKRIRLLADSMPGLMGYMDAEQRIGFINALAEVWLDRPRSEIVGRKLEEVLSAEHYEIARPAVEAALAGKRVSGESVVVYPDGVERHIHRDFIPDVSEDGKVRGYYYFNHDITERKRAEEAARAVEERFKAIVNNSPNLIYLKDTAGRYLLVNKEFERTIGLPLGLALGKTPHDWAPAEDAESYLAQDRVVIESGGTIEQEELVRYGDGTVHTQIMTKFPIFDAAGNVEAVVGINTDITERKEAEAALRESESLLTLAAEQADLGHWVWDTAADRCVYASRQLARILDLSTAEEYVVAATSHEADLDWVHPDDRDRYDRVVWEAFDKGLPFDIEYRIVRRNGEVRHVHGRCEPLPGPTGAMTRAIGTLLDVTERKAAEVALRESEERLRAIIDNAPVHISMKDLGSRHMVVSPNSEKILGYPSERVLGRTSHEIFSKEEADFFMAHDRVVQESGRTLAMENEITLPDGVHTINTIRFPIRGAAGEISAIGAISTDVNDGKKAEEAMRERETLLTHAADIAGLGHWVWDDLADKCILCSEQVAQIHGYATPEEYMAMASSYEACLDTVHPEDRGWYDRLVRESDRLKKPYATEFRILRRDGEVRYVREAADPILNDAGELVRSLGTIQDITERKEAEKVLRESEKMLTHAADLAGIGHWVWDDLADKLILCSDRVAEIYGYDSPEAYAAMATSYEADLEIVHPEDRGWYDRLVRESDRLKQPYETEYRILRRDGAVRYVREVADPILNDAGELVRTIGTIQDITERKEAETALRESEKLLAHSAAIGGLGHWMWDDVADKCILCSEQVAEIHGYATPEEYMAMASSYEVCLETVHPEDRGWYDRLVRESDRVQQSYETEFRILRRDGEVRYVREVADPILNDAGEHVRTLGTMQDITERKEAEKALRESERRFRDYAEASADWFWETDADLGLTYLSPNVERIAGVPPAWHYGKKVWDAIGQGFDREAWDAHLARMRAHEPFRDFTYYRAGKGVAPRWLRLGGVPMFDEGGAFFGYRGSGSDVTEQRRAEDSLREREAEFRTVLDNLPAAVYLTDLEGRVRLVNRRFSEWYGLSADEALGKLTSELFPAEAAEAFVMHDRAVLDEMRVIDRQLEVPVAGGAARAVRSSKFPVVDKDGRCIGVGTIDTDVTQLIRAERVAKLGHWAWDEIEDRELYRSEEADLIWGTTTGAMFENLDEFLATIHAEDSARVRGVMEAASEAGTGYQVEYRIVRADGGLHVILEIAEPELDEAGRLVRTTGVVQDITERKTLEDQLHQSQKMEVVGQLTSGIAHDFNNLLAVILGIVPIRLMQVATECSLYVRSKGVLFPPLRIGRETGHERLVDVPRALPRRGIMHPGLGGSTLAVWVCVRPLRAPAGLSAQGAGARLRMRGLRSSRVGDGGNHLPPHPHTVAQMVPGGVVDGAGQARGLGPVPGARAGASL